ncbi:hypothetical protein [Cereibacter johrii]|uniref:hypothetical protein n=1 Tax=Cereibacter johrii TaxID=445629 RepID=UPI0008471BA9|nr:hypothetical protein [Cereibacter johrii]ODM42800.1 hypothetical protein A9O63_00500 [Cereibacter johrii]
MSDGGIALVQVLQIGGLAGVISAVVAASIKEHFDGRERARKAQFLALRLSLALETYFRICVDRIFDIEDFRGSRGNGGDNHVGLPAFVAFPPDSDDWRYLKHSITDELLNFPSEVRAIDESIHFEVFMDGRGADDGPDPEITLKPLYEVAFRSIELAKKVRDQHALPEVERARALEGRLLEKQTAFLDHLQRERAETGF